MVHPSILRLAVCSAIVSTLALAQFAVAKSVTAPYSPDQALINPAAATTRSHKSYVIQLNRSEDILDALNLVDSSYRTETIVNTLQANAAIKYGNLFAEFSISPQLGDRSTVSSYSSATYGSAEGNLKNTISLNPIQAVVATKLGNNLSVGTKLLYAYTDFQTKDGFKIVNGTDLIATTADRSTNVQFAVLSGGFTYKFLGDFYFGYSADLTQVTTVGTSLSATDQRGGISAAIRSFRTESNSTNKVLKNIVGLSYLTKGSGTNSFRAEVSYEKIPPLVKSSTLLDGELYRLIAEATWSYFHLGAEAWSKKGYYADPYNLIPYFFDPDKMSNDMTTEYGLFGGLRLSRGQSFGLSFFQSTERKREKLAPSNPTENEIEMTSRTFGISYSKIF